MNADELNKEISKTGKKWKAKDNEIAALNPTEKMRRLGFVPEPGSPSLKERENSSKAKKGKAIALVVPPLPGFDWRTYGDGIWMSPVRDQRNCGACVAFGTTATAEVKTRISYLMPRLAVHYSEADLFYCGGKGTGASCDPHKGWQPVFALGYFKTVGVADEACFPYTDHEQPCKSCVSPPPPEWRRVKIKNYHEITDVNEMKRWISTDSPLITTFTAYEDFFNYGSGVYSWVWGESKGGHCVSVVGYDDTQNCWICKNSWGTGWGDYGGFFKIAYHECGIDDTMYAIDAMDYFH